MHHPTHPFDFFALAASLMATLRSEWLVIAMGTPAAVYYALGIYFLIKNRGR